MLEMERLRRDESPVSTPTEEDRDSLKLKSLDVLELDEKVL